jgi:bifunctional DNase/RNase|tara:strand:+ start:1958 stop:2500 length:543 start_codon:yes stop_codon:yes gene_type:complete
MICVNVEKISYHPSSRSYAVILKTDDDDLVLPILVGSFEAQSIALALEAVATPRPLTHDLICEIIKGIDAELISVNISQLNDGVFYAKLKLKSPDFGTKTIDARPSDAISIALRLNTQIYVSPEIIKEAGVEQEDIISENQPIIPKYTIEDLEIKLKKAVEKEEYEKAAKLRDKIKDLES